MGDSTPITLWEHEGDRARRRAANARSDTEKVKFQRRIAEIVGGIEAVEGQTARRRAPDSLGGGWQAL